MNGQSYQLSNTHMNKIRFNPEINLGHVLQAVVGISVIMSMFYNMDKRLTVVELKQTYAETALKVANDNSAKMLALIQELKSK